EKELQRGDVITVQELGSGSAIIDVLVERSPRLKRNSPAARPMKNGSSVHIHFGTSRTAAKITLSDGATLAGGQSAIAQLRLDFPILAFASDRFVLRDSSQQTTIAGGTVLDPDANRDNFRSAAQRQFLRQRGTAPHAIDVCVRSQLQRDGFAESKLLLVKSNFAADEIRDALSQLAQSGEIVLADDIAADATYWRNLVKRATTVVDRVHEKNPERHGADVSELRMELEIQSDKLFSAVISQLTRNGFSRFENQIGRASHSPSLPPELVSAAEKIRAALSAAPFNPPDRKTFLHDQRLEQALRFLIEKKEIVEISREMVVPRDAAEEIQNAITKFLSETGSATASQIRQKIGTTRRVIIPFLEY